MTEKSITSPEMLRSSINSARSIMRKDKGLNGDLDRLPIFTWLMFLKFLDDLDKNLEVEAELAGKSHYPLIEYPYRWRDWAAGSNPTGDELLKFIMSDECLDPFASASSDKRIPGLFPYLRKLESSGSEQDRRKDVIATVFNGVDNRMKSGFLLKDVVAQIDKIKFQSSAELHTLGALYEGMLREMRDAAGDSGEFYTPRPVVRLMVQIMAPKLGEKVMDPASGTGGFLVEAFEYLSKQVKTVEDRHVLQSGSVVGAEPKPLPYLLCQMNLILHGVEAPDIDPGNSLRFKLSELGDADRVDIILTNPPFGGEEENGVQANFPNDRQSAETSVLFLQLIMRRLKRFGKGRAAVIVPNSTLFESGVYSRIREDLLTEFNLHSILRLPKHVFEPYTDIETNILFFDTNKPTEEILFYELPPPMGRPRYTKTKPIKYEDLSEAEAVLTGKQASSVNAWHVNKRMVLDDSRKNLDLTNPKISRTTAEPPLEVATKLITGISLLAELAPQLELSLSVLEQCREKGKGWKELHLSEILKREKNVIEIEDDELYKRLRIQTKGRGVTIRDEVLGSKIGTKRQFRVSAEMFVLSKIDARYGAFGLIPNECDSAIITGNFWAYSFDDEVIVPKLLVHLTRSDSFVDFCRRSSPGMTNRRYLQESLFLEQLISVPDNPIDQLRLCEALDQIEMIGVTLERDLKRLSTRSAGLLQSALHSVFGGEAVSFDEEDENPTVVDGD